MQAYCELCYNDNIGATVLGALCKFFVNIYFKYYKKCSANRKLRTDFSDEKIAKFK